jgi:peptidoglycan hydrolase-like protein with peptidoglycan-binding domain
VKLAAAPADIARMPSRPRACACLVAVAAALAWAGAAAGAGESRVAALQVGLHARGLYAGTIDGVAGPSTAAAVRTFQRRAHLSVDGIAGPRTRAALGRYGRHTLGSRQLAARAFGWDVAELQFLLAWHGFPSGPFDGHLGGRTARALRRFQRFAGLRPDGVAGAGTFTALRAPLPRLPISLAWPLGGPIGSAFGPRGHGFHAGIDVIAPAGTPVAAAASGRVVWAGYRAGGWGLLVTIAHGAGVRTMYAHLSRVNVRVGERVGVGARVGRVGATGDADGPHLHFEARLRGAAVDPLPALR